MQTELNLPQTEETPCPYPKQNVPAEGIAPCPCCGGKAYAYHCLDAQGNQIDDLNWIECAECNLATPICDTVEMAKSIWNRRWNP